MATLNLGKYKAENESRMAEEKRIADRKRNLMILIEKYLLTMGYVDSDTADNIDLYMILCEYEEFFEFKYSHPPKLVKKLAENAVTSLPKISMKKGSSFNTLEKKPPIKNDKKTPNSSNTHTKTSEPNQKESKDSNEPIEITGNSIANANKKKEEEDNFYENRVLKAIPQELLDIPDLRDLAQYLQRDICIENPNVKFTDIVGLEKAKALLKEAVLLPLKYPHFFTGLLEPWKGVLLFGPPGTGKTMLAKAVASECKTTFFNISASSIVSKWRGDSEKLVRVLFELARYHQPSTIFLDELDSIMSQRNSVGTEHEGSRRMKTELLIQLDGLIKNKERVFLLAASNLPWDLDVAMLRRLEKRILVPLPELNSREAMLQKFLPEGIAENLPYLEIAEKLKDYSGSDIRLVCKESAMKPVRRLMKQLEDINYEPSEIINKKTPLLNKQATEKIMPGPVLKEDINEAINTTKPTLLLNTEKYEKWEKEFGST